ncbi:major facilitator superfamily-domain-containing protein [Dendryphion nanum]|uniref:Major facilitator superfamily-domain-containing protein n=1 Tax=Dendryphion nanum TaxID=256645 RepID=A0A9P9E3J4_9PLEO|nr:major facilitator superfamily-domain-containing protein [Dendryphion nanum]
MNSPPKESSSVPEKDTMASNEIPLVEPTEPPTEKPEHSDQFMSGIKLYTLVFGLGLAVFLMALDMSIIVTAIPIITEKFNSTKDIGWYMSAYLLAICSLQPLSGKLYANFSLKWTFLSFLTLFLLGSILSGAATSSPTLIIGRAIAGSGAAGLFSGTLSILASTVELRLRALYTGILSSLFGVSTVAGPLIGGAFTEHVSWRWVFYINLPIGGLTVAALIWIFHPPIRAIESEPILLRIKRLDLFGAALFIPPVVMILLALQWGGISYPWSSPTIIGLFTGAGVLLILFSLWQYRVGQNGMLPPHILFQRTVFFASLAAMFGMGAQILLGVWMPEWFQAVKGASPTESGVRLLPTMLGQVVASIVSGIMITKLGYANPWLLAGTVLMAIASGLFTTFEVDTGSAYWIGYQALYGLGAGMFLTAPLVAVQAVLGAEDTPVGIAAITFFQMFGGALFSGASQTLFNEKLVKELAKNAPGADVGKLLAAGTTALHKAVTPELFPGVLKSYNTALLAPFYLGAAVTAVSFFCGLGMEWVSVKGKNLMAVDAA